MRATNFILLAVVTVCCVQIIYPVSAFTIASDFTDLNEREQDKPDTFFRYDEDMEYDTDPLETPGTLWTEDDHLGNETEHCRALVLHMAEEGGNFTYCLIRHSQPFRMCERCVTPYTRFNNLYKELLEDTRCKRLLLMSDRKQAISNTYKVFHTAWTSALCDKCFDYISENTTTGHVSFNFSESTLLFHQLKSQVSRCFRNYSHMIDPVGNSSQVCHACQPVYENMNKHFWTLNKQSDGQICMDVMDMMNRTWLAWSSDFHCHRTRLDPGAVIAIGCIVVVLTTGLYIASKCLAKTRLPQISRAKRMKGARGRQLYGTISSIEVSSINGTGQVLERLPHDLSDEHTD